MPRLRTILVAGAVLAIAAAVFGLALQSGNSQSETSISGDATPARPKEGDASAPAPDLPENDPPRTWDGMVWIPGGQFTMGSDHPLGRPDELPLHEVRVDGLPSACGRRFAEGHSRLVAMGAGRQLAAS